MMLIPDNTRSIVKKIARFFVTASVGYTVTNVLTANTPADKTHQKVEVAVGSFIVGSMASDAAGSYTDEKVDSLFDWFETVKLITAKTPE